jgi:hypothetical protein
MPAFSILAIKLSYVSVLFSTRCVGVHLKLYLEVEKVFRKLFTQTNVDRQLDVAALRQIHSFS